MGSSKGASAVSETKGTEADVKAKKESTKVTKDNTKTLKKQSKAVKNFGGSIQNLGFGALALTGTMSTMDVEGQGWLKSSMQMMPAMSMMTSGFDTSADALKRSNINARKQARSLGFGRGGQRVAGAVAAGGKNLMGKAGMAGIATAVADPLVDIARQGIMGSKTTVEGTAFAGRAGQTVGAASNEEGLAQAAKGAIGGASFGAAIGSVIAPGIGTAIGAALGGVVGGAVGFARGSAQGASEQ